MKNFYALLLTLTVSTLSFGQVVLNENLNYADNSLLTANGWLVASGGGTNAIDVGASNGLTYAGYTGLAGITGAVAGNAARLDNTGEDDYKTFTAVTSGTLYYSFLVNVADGTAGYFTSLGTGTGSFAGRVFVRPSATAGKINFGLGNTATGVFNASATDFDINTTYLVVVKYDVSATGAASIWILPSGVPATEAAAGTPEVSVTGSGLASITGVYLRQYNASQNITLDAIYVANTWFGTAPCSLSLGTETAVCDAVTLSIDTYTATIPFTGGNSGTYALSASAGVVGGDNPNTTAAGNITITNVPEGTNVTLTITGTCGLSKIVAGPSCEPINALPYNEPFNYAPATVLASTQMWTTVNTGDDIVVASGNLSYTGITSTGNSVTFSGDGAEARTPFTSTNSGTIYASFLSSVTDISNITTDLAFTYYALFTDAGGASTNARVWLRRNGTQYQYGLGTGSTPTTWAPTLYNIGETHYIVLGYDFATNLLSLFIDAPIGGTSSPAAYVTPASPFAALGGFMLRQDSNITTPTVIIDELSVKTTADFTLATEGFNAISGLNVYPNPANDILYVTSAANGVKTVAIYDVVGKQVLNVTASSDAINVSSLNAGIYLVKITEEGKTATRKLVIK